MHEIRYDEEPHDMLSSNRAARHEKTFTTAKRLVFAVVFLHLTTEAEKQQLFHALRFPCYPIPMIMRALPLADAVVTPTIPPNGASRIP